MSLSKASLYPQYLVLVFISDSSGRLVELHHMFLASNRRALQSEIENCANIVRALLRSDAYDSFSADLSPSFRVYHLTRAKN